MNDVEVFTLSQVMTYVAILLVVVILFTIMLFSIVDFNPSLPDPPPPIMNQKEPSAPAQNLILI